MINAPSYFTVLSFHTASIMPYISQIKARANDTTKLTRPAVKPVSKTGSKPATQPEDPGSQKWWLQVVSDGSDAESQDHPQRSHTSKQSLDKLQQQGKKKKMHTQTTLPPPPPPLPPPIVSDSDRGGQYWRGHGPGSGEWWQCWQHGWWSGKKDKAWGGCTTMIGGQDCS